MSVGYQRAVASPRQMSYQHEWTHIHGEVKHGYAACVCVFIYAALYLLYRALQMYRFFFWCISSRDRGAGALFISLSWPAVSRIHLIQSLSTLSLKHVFLDNSQYLQHFILIDRSSPLYRYTVYLKPHR
ncbi:hypothetical protein CYLTODRAFT_149862 [Cylindrobasidium torrendii FP15055 ss-10]|uniref:Uncharacterized protein n=1 Tax=Cylindrobasidium torrendii FP15055 ss-10 TaxID=1314674 RepID=A0A0D7AXV8_9AGAR|nr:hypothetical protein CYLTODRAFT_149862 [Cylindrobasidium torrendii FP15055 ss-10]